MGNHLNKPYMEVEGNQTTGKTSIDGWTVLKITAIFEEGGRSQSDNWKDFNRWMDCFEDYCHF